MEDFDIEYSDEIKKEGKKNALNVKRKRKSNLFEIDYTKNLEQQIQTHINKEWKNQKWEKTEGNNIRENARKLLQMAFFSNSSIASENEFSSKAIMIVWAIEQTVFDKWFIFQFGIYL